MGLHIEPEIWHLFPGMVLAVAVGEGLDNRGPNLAVDAELEQAVEGLRAGWSYPNPQSHPRVAAWREAAAAMGISGKRFPSSIEALVRRVVKDRGMARINPLVDFYNAVSLAEVVTAGGWDVDELAGGRLHLRRAAGGEPFRELGRSEAVTVATGEVGYADDREIITRHLVWRQSEKAKVTPETRRVFLVSEVLPAAGRDVAELAERVRSRFEEGLRRHFKAERVRTALLAAPERHWAWSDG